MKSKIWLAVTVLLCSTLLHNPGIAQQAPSAMANLIDQCQPKMAKVIGAGAGRIDGYATGVIVSPDGLVLTCLLYTSPSPRDRG